MYADGHLCIDLLLHVQSTLFLNSKVYAKPLSVVGNFRKGITSATGSRAGRFGMFALIKEWSDDVRRPSSVCDIMGWSMAHGLWLCVVYGCDYGYSSLWLGGNEAVSS